jgi:hypothetical protein
MPIAIFLVPILTAVILFAGWVNNIIWTFHQTDMVSLILGVLGALVAPVGALHGLYLFF